MLARIRPWLAWLLPALLQSALLLVMAPPALAGAPRLALVVGEAAYPARPLATIGNDAALVAQALAQVGFEVTAAHDLDAKALGAALAGFVEAARTAGPDAVLVVYLAGYGVQYDGGNYLVPVDARLVHDNDVPSETASLDDFVRALAAVPAKARLVAVDASRAQPFATADEMPLAPGLGLTTAPAGTLVAFAAAPGMIAADDAPPYGAYARALAETLAVRGLAPGYLLDRVRLRVGELTDGEQVPWDDGALADGITLTPDVAPAPPIAQVPPPGGTLTPDTAYSVVIARDALASDAEFLRLFPDGPLATRIRVLQAVRREATMWQAAAASDDPRADWTYMRRYPRGPHRFDARRRLAALHAALEPPPRFDVFVFPALPPPPAAELALVAAPEQALRGLPPIPPPPAALLPPPDPAYYDALPMPVPAPAGLLPIAPPLPGTGEPARITQARPDHGATISETQLDPDGNATVTLADATGLLVEMAAGAASADVRTLVETGPAPVVADATKQPAPTDQAGDKSDATHKPATPKPVTPKPAPVKAEPPVLSRTTVTRTAEGVTITQVGPDRGTLLEIATRAEADGGHVTRVTGVGGMQLASWRRDPQGIVVARDVGAGAAPAAAEAPAASRTAAPAPAPQRATSPSSPSPPPRVTPPAPIVAAPASAPTPPLVPVPVAPAPARPPRAQPVPAPAPMLPKLAPPAPPEPPLAPPPAPVPQTTAPAPPVPPAPLPAIRPSVPSPVAPLPPRRPGRLASKPEPSRNKTTAARKPTPAHKPAPPRRPAPRRAR